MNDRELMHMAMYALMTCREDWIFDGEDERPVDTYDKKLVSAAFKALRARLEQPEPEPVAWMEKCADFWEHYTYINEAAQEKYNEEAKMWIEKLRDTHPQRQWQGLTDEECLQNPYCAGENDDEVIQLARAIEAKLKEKNCA